MINNKVHLLTLDMGYGHQRAAYPLTSLSKEGPIAINNYPGISFSEKRYWQKSRQAYEKISYFKRTPILGDAVFSLMDYFQKIDNFYPKRDLNKKTLQQKNFFRKIKLGLGKKLIQDLNNNPVPIISTFFVGAYMAEYHAYKGDVYCLLCDADISRAWAVPDSIKSKVKYLVPTKISAERLKMYGVRPEMIIEAGFPLPLENIGDEDFNICKKDLANRIPQLDPNKHYYSRYNSLLKSFLPDIADKTIRPLTITFTVGGAGAQRDLGFKIINKLKKEIIKERVVLNLVAGSREDVYDYFKKGINKVDLKNVPGINIIYHKNKAEYFSRFNKCLRKTDILWTKPSELSFYSALGIPIIMSQPIGAQEYKNRDWLISIGAAHDSLDVNYINEWLFDWLEGGRLAKSAVDAFLNAPRLGTYNIQKIFNQ
jgi:hypothetical protein